MRTVIAILSLAISVFSRKTVIITGGNRGIGLAAAKKLSATKDWDIVLACRSLDKGIKAADSFRSDSSKVDVFPLDLADLNSVKDFAKSWGNKPIDCLVLNAGIQIGSGSQPMRTKQGFESTIGTNHIGHFYLTNLLLPKLEKVKASRIVVVGSGVHNPDEPGGDVGSKATLGYLQGFNEGFQPPVSMVDGGTYDPDKAYKDSKLCNIITSLELSRRLKAKKSKTTCNVMNPGLVPTTGLFREFNFFFVTIFTFLTRQIFKVAVSEETAGEKLAYLVDSKEMEGVSGQYYSGRPNKNEFISVEPSVEARDEKKAKLLWELTEKIIKKAGF